MLQIRYKGRKSRFHYDVKKRDVKDKIAEHLFLWKLEKIKDENGLWQTVPIPVEDVIVEWQDGSVWKEDAPVETIPLK